MPKSYLSKTVANLKASGIRKFFDIAATMENVISLGIGEPDFTTPRPIIDAGGAGPLQGRDPLPLPTLASWSCVQPLRKIWKSAMACIMTRSTRLSSQWASPRPSTSPSQLC